MAGNLRGSQPNKLYLNDGTSVNGGFNTPGTAIGSETTDETYSVVLGDVNSDGHLDLVTGNDGKTKKLYLNDGSGGFPGINTPGTAIGSETESTYSVVLGDVDGDGDLDLVAGNSGRNKLVKTIAYNTNAGNIYSTKVNGAQTGIMGITLTAVDSTVTTPNTSVDYFVSNKAGTNWYKATPGVELSFPDTGTNDVRWRASLKSLSPVRSPMIGEVILTYTLTPSAAAILKVSTATSNAVSSLTITIDDLMAIDGLNDVNADNLAAYQAAIVAAADGDLNTLAKIQGMVTTVNTAVAIAISAISAISAIDAVTTNASGITEATLNATGVTGVVTDNLAAYQAAIVAAADGDLNTLAKIQGMVDAVNMLVDIGAEADDGVADSNFLAASFTTTLALNNIVSSNIVAYNSYIDANADLFSAIATSAEVQSMVHIVNVIEAAGLNSLTSQHLVLAGVVVNASTDPVNTLSAAELAQVSSDINAANPVTTAALQGIAEQVVTPVIALTGNATVSIEAGGNYTEQGAIASDVHDVDTSPTVTVGGDSVDASSVGSYTVTYNATDASGNVASQVTRTVNVVDTTAPVITVTAGTDTIERGSAWTDAGATTTEGTITTSGTVDTAVAGTYAITYSATDASDLTTTETRTVTVVDTTAPVITVTAGTDTIERGSAWTDAGATTTEGTITTSGTVDTAVAGTYAITYSATDASDLTTTATRTVTVVDTTAPVITVTTGTDTIERGSAWTDAGATTTEGTITTSGTVDTAVAGTYTITYSATDASSLTTTATRTVTVVDTTAPVITVTTGTDTIERGSAWTDAGATTTEGTISTSGTVVDTAVAGTYTITYSATDASSLTTTATRTVTVVDTTAPVITVTAGTDTIERGSAWTDAGATTTEGTITTSGTVDTDVAGTYAITYSATDASDLTTTATRTVTVVDTTAPVITVTAGTDTIERGSAWTDAGATTTEGTITTSGTVDTAVAGTYAITYSATDASDLTTTETRTVTVVDTTAPVITVTAGTDTIERGSAWTDAGATTTEGTITTSGTVDTAVAGTYAITYSATDASDLTTTETRTVTVVDTTAPVITVTAGTDTIERGSAWTDAGATTTEGTITTSGTVDTDVAGTYAITYSATDASDLTTTETRTVTVVDTTAPVITVTGANPTTVEQGAIYTDAGATATDAVDGDLSDNISVTGSVDTTSMGTYTLTYNVSDAAGNVASEVTRTVVVEPIPITLFIPDDLTVNAVGYLTGVNLDPEGIASAADGDGNAIDIVADQTGPFQSGNYEIEWSATSAGRTVSATQRLKIRPLVNLATAIRTTEGDSIDVEVLLSGQAADYPVIVPFIVSGTAVEGEDYSVSSTDSVTITEGTMASVSLSITADDIAESEESVVITLGEATNAALGVSSEQVITILEENLPPQVTLQVSQAGVVGSSIAQNAGTAMIKPEVDDANATDTYTVDWTNALLTLPEASVVVVDGEGAGFPYEVLEFDPADLTAGVYLVAVDVSDGVNSVSIAVNINVLTQTPVLSEEVDSDGDGISDAEEGAGDSDGDGIPDYEDNIVAPNLIPSGDGSVNLESEPGTTLTLGSVALGAGDNNVSITEEEIAATENVAEDPGYDYPEALIDFAATGAEFGHSYALVVPLSVVLPEGAVYRKYSALGGWANFVENATNALSSAITVLGVCPELGSDAYTPGLTEGDNCLQLLIKDGGPNDADGVANGTLVDPGGIAIKYIGTPSDSSEITLSSAQLTANGSASATVTVTVLDAQGVGLEHMSVSASVAVSGAGVGTFVEQGSGVYTATLTAGNTAGSAAVVAVIDNGEVSVTVSSDPITLKAVAVVTPPSSGGGCTVATDGSADASLLLLLIMAGLLLARRRYQLR